MTLEPRAEVTPRRLIVHEENLVLRSGRAGGSAHSHSGRTCSDRRLNRLTYSLTGPIGTCGPLGLIVLQVDETMAQALPLLSGQKWRCASAVYHRAHTSFRTP